MNLLWSIRYVHCTASRTLSCRSKRNELWWARIKLIIQRFQIVIISCDGKCILRWMHIAPAHIISYKNVHLIRWPKGILSMAAINKPARVPCSSSMSSSSILIYFSRKFRFLSHRSLFLSFTLGLTIISILFIVLLLVRTAYWARKIRWELNDVQEFFHVTGNYNQLNRFPVLKRSK